MNYYSKSIDIDLITILLSYENKINVRNEADFYGASKLIAENIGLKQAPKSFASWSHGVTYCDLKYTEQIIWNKGWVKNRLVANDKIQSFLSNSEVDKVKAVGMPIVYVPSLNITRRQNSVLIMLAHSLPYTKVDHDLTSVIALCKKLKDDGCYVCFCIHMDCFLQGTVTSELEENNIDWFVGASPSDANSLQRMRNIFEYFDTVGSNAIGSHFYYAQLFGAKFFFINPFFEYSTEIMKNDINYKNKSELLKHNLKESSRSVIEKKFSNYFVDYKSAICDQALAEQKCGTNNKLNPEELAKLLGWNVKDQILSPFAYYGSKLVSKVNNKYFRKC